MIVRFAAALLVLAALAGCGKSPSADDAAKDGVLLLGNGEEPNSLDPQTAASLAEAHALYALFEGLVSPDPYQPDQIAPGAAESWTTSNNGLVYTFRIRPDAVWTNGDLVTAHDFVNSAERALNPEFSAAFPELFFDLRNARPYYEGAITDFTTVGIRALDDRALQLTLDSANHHFLSKLKHFAWMPVHRKSLESQGAWSQRGVRWFAPGKIVSNGPFELVKWQASSQILVRKSRTHWDRNNTTLNEIRFAPYENAQTERLAFLAGQFHVTDKIPAEFLHESLHSTRIRKDPYLSTSYLIFNTRSGPLADPALRSALALSLDKKELADAIERSGKPATSFTPPGISGYEPPVGTARNPRLAKAALDSYRRRAGGAPELVIAVSNNPASRAMVEAVQAMWQETLGLSVEIRNMEAKSLFSALDSGSFDISYLSWTADYASPEAFLDLWSGGNPKNRSGWNDPRYNALLSAARSESKAELSARLYAEAETVLLDQTPIVPLIWKTKNFYIAPSVKEWPPAQLDMRSYRRIQLAPTNP